MLFVYEGVGGGVGQDRVFVQVVLDHGGHVREDGLVVGHPDPEGVGEAEPAVEVDVFDLRKVGVHVVLVEAPVHGVEPPAVGACA